MATEGKLLGTILVMAIASLHAVASEQPEKPKPGVLFKGAVIPKPPQQGQPWKPPASRLSEKWITAAEELYRHGFADPRLRVSRGEADMRVVALGRQHVGYGPRLGPARGQERETRSATICRDLEWNRLSRR